jgi:glutathione reductase (NADPH)
MFGRFVRTSTLRNFSSTAGKTPRSLLSLSTSRRLQHFFGTFSNNMSTAAAADEYDMLVIGGGSGGLGCARRAAQYGAKVGLVEYGDSELDWAAGLGGTCVNRGCVPKKIMYNMSSFREEIMHDAPGYTFTNLPKQPEFDFGKMKSQRDAYIQRLHGIYERNLGKDGVELIRGRAEFASADTLAVNGTHYKAKHIVISVGGRPRMPTEAQVPGIEHAISSGA